MLAHSLPLPLTVFYYDTDREMTTEDEEGASLSLSPGGTSAFATRVTFIQRATHKAPCSWSKLSGAAGACALLWLVATKSVSLAHPHFQLCSFTQGEGSPRTDACDGFDISKRVPCRDSRFRSLHSCTVVERVERTMPDVVLSAVAINFTDRCDHLAFKTYVPSRAISPLARKAQKLRQTGYL
jgi:hypothetical protein